MYRKISTTVIIELMESTCVLLGKGEAPGGHRNSMSPYPLVWIFLHEPHSPITENLPCGKELGERSTAAIDGGAVSVPWTLFFSLVSLLEKTIFGGGMLGGAARITVVLWHWWISFAAG